MKTWLIKGIIAFLVGLVVAPILYVITGFTPYPGYVLGTLMVGFGIGMCISYKKFMCCILAACLAVSPNIIADDYYSGFNGGQCYCFDPALDNPVAQEAFILEFIVENGAPRIISCRHPDPSTLVDWDGLNESLAPWGINLNDGMQFYKNAQPAWPTDMPFVFGDSSAPLAIFPSQTQFPLIIEFSTDLVTWQPLARVSVPEGVRVQFHDSPEGAQTFYRVNLESSPLAFQPAGPILIGCGLGLLVGTGTIAVLAVRACARNKKKFEKMLPPQTTNTNQPPQQCYEKKAVVMSGLRGQI